MLTHHLRRHFTTSVAARGTQLVTLHYNDLLAGVDLSKDIQRAYGPSGLGALTIAGIPGYMEARYALLPLSHKIAHLPESEKVKLEHPESMYNVGWSHGKEKMGDKPDTSKGSYYGNPLVSFVFSYVAIFTRSLLPAMFPFLLAMCST